MQERSFYAGVSDEVTIAILNSAGFIGRTTLNGLALAGKAALAIHAGARLAWRMWKN